ncbi:MAG TPA: hypothetical protein VKF81_16745 [Blastocatellia bacterium]|nr:hypothetical protein [Blastocatellia bacterium]
MVTTLLGPFDHFYHRPYKYAERIAFDGGEVLGGGKGLAVPRASAEVTTYLAGARTREIAMALNLSRYAWHQPN